MGITQLRVIFYMATMNKMLEHLVITSSQEQGEVLLSPQGVGDTAQLPRLASYPGFSPDPTPPTDTVDLRQKAAKKGRGTKAEAVGLHLPLSPWAFGGAKDLGSEEGDFGSPSSPLEVDGGAHGAPGIPRASF